MPFDSAAVREGFTAAYDAVLARWPRPPETYELPGEFGRTHVLALGPPDGPPVVLLPGGGATATVWWNTVGALAEDHRVYAVDRIGDLGRSVADGRPLRTPADVMSWMDGVLDALGVGDVVLAGHSYGAWQALTWALHAPGRVRGLALVDPTDCFDGLGWAYRFRALPVLLAPSRERWRRFLAWETGGAALDPDWVDLVARAGEVRTARPVLPRRPRADRLRTLDVPTLVVLAGRSRAVHAGRAARAARGTLPRADVVVLDDQTHHTLPAHGPAALNDALRAFLRRV